MKIKLDNNKFEEKNKKLISLMSKNRSIHDITKKWFEKCSKYQYSYHFRWLGLPIIQFPQDIIAMQEIIWKVKPDLIIESGIARGGSLIFYASLLELLGKGKVIGIDIDIRKQNKVAIKKHPMYRRIIMLEGSSTDEKITKKVYEIAKKKKKVIVCLDSRHNHKHVLKELQLYSPLVTKGSYLVVFDTITNDMPASFSANHPWGKNNNPKTAIWEFLETNDRFEMDKDIENKLLITVAPDGYLKCIK